MKNLINNYKEKSYEEKTILKTIFSLFFSTILTCSKFIIGFFTDYNLISIAIFTFCILFAKFECIVGIKKEKNRNTFISIFLFISSIIYICSMCRMFFIDRHIKNQSIIYVITISLISFVELGCSITGLIKTTNKGQYYQNIKIINFCVALIAILTTQISILNMTSKTNSVDILNAYTGIAVGIFIALCAIFIFFAPITRTIGREHNVFQLKNSSENKLIDMNKPTFKLILHKSLVYGSYYYIANISDKNLVDGNIEQSKSIWNNMHLFWKIICCILSEILIFIWLIGRLFFFLRTINLPKKLEIKMKNNGFIKINN